MNDTPHLSSHGKALAKKSQDPQDEAYQTCRPRDARRAKYELVTSLRTHLGREDDAFGCMGTGEDAEGMQGVFLRKNVIAVCGRALKANMTALAPRVLPYSELVRHMSLLAAGGIYVQLPLDPHLNLKDNWHQMHKLVALRRKRSS